MFSSPLSFSVSLLALVQALPAQDLAARERELDELHQLRHPESAMQSLAARERDLTSMLQARLESDRAAGRVHFFLGKKAVPTTPENELVPSDNIPNGYFKAAEKALEKAGQSTPLPSAAYINAQPPKPRPTSWESVMQDAAQPLDTKIGGSLMYSMTGGVTPTPPPTQNAIGQEFVAQCPMLLIGQDLSIRAPSCKLQEGRWVDPSPLNPDRSILRWRPDGNANNLYFGVDSALSGPGSALFAKISEQMTLTGYHFAMTNCMGIERWKLEENVYKIDSMGHVTSTVELHDVTMNSKAYFLKYIIRSPTGATTAESSLFRMDQNQVNFTVFDHGGGNGKLLAVATRQGQWTKSGWSECMSASSPRGWSIYFPPDGPLEPSTVQDIRVAITGTMTLMAYRDQFRNAEGLDTEADQYETFVLMITLAAVFFMAILFVNFCIVFRASGIKDKLKRVLSDTQGAFLPKMPMMHHTPPFHPSY